MKKIHKENETENMMIAHDLKSFGFSVDCSRKGVVRVFLKRFRVYSHDVVRALSSAGYEDSQYTVNDACGDVFVRAVVA